jgi:hypothetical protein
MNRFGKLNSFGELIYAPEILKMEDGTIIVSPSSKDYLRLGYKEIIEEEKPSEFYGKNTEMYYEETESIIYIKHKLSTEMEEDTEII